MTLKLWIRLVDINGTVCTYKVRGDSTIRDQKSAVSQRQGLTATRLVIVDGTKVLPDDYEISNSVTWCEIIDIVDPLVLVRDELTFNMITIWRPCATCGASAHRKCVNCKGIYYCNVECQRKGWESHKKDCRRL